MMLGFLNLRIAGLEALFYERRLRSFTALIEEAKNMDADAGLRVLGRYKGQTCFAFVTRFGLTYTVMIYERLSGRGKIVGRRLAVIDCLGAEELQSLLKKLTSARVIAFSY